MWSLRLWFLERPCVRYCFIINESTPSYSYVASKFYYNKTWVSALFDIGENVLSSSSVVDTFCKVLIFVLAVIFEEGSWFIIFVKDNCLDYNVLKFNNSSSTADIFLALIGVYMEFFTYVGSTGEWSSSWLCSSYVCWKCSLDKGLISKPEIEPKPDKSLFIAPELF